VVERRKGSARYFTEDLGDGVKLDMVEIPGGSFLMGSPDTEEKRYDDEGPQHRVTVPSFFMGKFPVTQAQWHAVANLPAVHRALDPAPSYFEGDDRPVEQVSWEEAMEFCQRLAQKTGRPYRLPSEAEWEYACRAGTTTPFHFGETITPELVNYDGNYPYGTAPEGAYREETTPVGSFKVANAFGLYDMHGNVWEWCHSLYEPYPYRAEDGREDESDSGSRVLRGGAFHYVALDVRCASRGRYDPDDRDNDLGFRVVVSPFFSDR
jgi:formylglycine-generating enzyme required for sulfatase activity